MAIMNGGSSMAGSRLDQDPAAVYRFEVATIKRSISKIPAPFYIVNNTKGRFEAEHATLKQLIVTAYGAHEDEVSGGPSWTNSERFDVAAKVDESISGPAGVNVRSLMLRQLLLERFGLTMHSNPKEASAYELGFARTDRKLGDDLKKSSVVCEADRPGQFLASTGTVECGPGFRPGMLSGRGITVEQIGWVLTRELRQPVVDKTGLTDRFDVTLQWTPPWLRDLVSRFGTPPAGSDQLIDSNGPSIFEAIEKRLGLKLRATKVLRPVYTIDRADKPRVE